MPVRELYALRQLRRRYESERRSPYAAYADDPVAYAQDILGVTWWDKQAEVARSVVAHNKTLVRASQAVGKTHVSGGIANWHYDVFDPGITLTTAPTSRQVRDLLWREIRAQRRGRPGLYPKAPRLESSDHHYAHGYTADDATAFQGTHEEQLLIIADEALGISADIWEAFEAMLTSGAGNRLLAIYNPTDTASAVYEAEQADDVHVITISALDHPNIAAELAGLEPPFPKAVRLSWVEARIREWCTPIAAGDATPDDVEFPPGSGNWYRPGAQFESRVLGRYPRQATSAVWSEAAFMAAIDGGIDEPQDEPCEIGCDVARFGDDDTAMHVRRGAVSLHHERHNGWGTDQTAGRLKELAGIYGQRSGVDPRKVALKVDDDGVGGGVVDQLRGWNVQPINAGSHPIERGKYPNRRSELWFAVAERAMERNLDLSRLPDNVKRDLRRQCLAPVWKLDSQGRRVVEPKADTKKRLTRSPDDADAMNLAYAAGPTVTTIETDWW